MYFARNARAHLFCSLEFHAQFNYMMFILFSFMIPFYIGYVTIYIKITFRTLACRNLTTEDVYCKT